MDRLKRVFFDVDEWNWVFILIQALKLLVWICAWVNKKNKRR